LVLCGYRGSVAHNTYIPDTEPNSTDDIDLMGVYMAPKEYYVGLGYGKIYRKAVEKFIDKWDTVSYEFRKFIHLLLKSNPNILSLLWVIPQHYLEIEDPIHKAWGKMLVDNRDCFTSRKIYKSFTGYAKDEFKAMTKHERKGYMGKKRKALIKKYGYDVKNASHLIRLLKMEIEYLDNGELKIFREEDARLLKDIKTGKWTLTDVIKYSDKLFKDAKKAYKYTNLPEEPNTKKIEELVMDIIMEYICY